jgi:hypothetical protein
VAPGEAVYIGTFVGMIETKLAGTRAGSVSKSYEMVPADAAGIVKQLKVDPSRLRSVDMFAGRDRAWKQFQEPEGS